MTNKLESLFNIKGKVIVITGAAGLLGKRHAEAVAAYGGNPILLDLSVDEVERYSVELNNRFGVNAIGMAVDITSEQQIKDNVHEIISRYGKIDGLVNNAANNPKMEQEGDTNFSRLENFPLEICSSSKR